MVKVDQMDSRALTVTAKKVLDNHPGEEFQVFIVWKCKILKNWKYLVSSTVEDGRYYELTYNGEKGEWYVDTYIKVRNESLTSETIDRMEV